MSIHANDDDQQRPATGSPDQRVVGTMSDSGDKLLLQEHGNPEGYLTSTYTVPVTE